MRMDPSLPTERLNPYRKHAYLAFLGNLLGYFNPKVRIRLPFPSHEFLLNGAKGFSRFTSNVAMVSPSTPPPAFFALTSFQARVKCSIEQSVEKVLEDIKQLIIFVSV